MISVLSPAWHFSRGVGSPLSTFRRGATVNLIPYESSRFSSALSVHLKTSVGLVGQVSP